MFIIMFITGNTGPRTAQHILHTIQKSSRDSGVQTRRGDGHVPSGTVLRAAYRLRGYGHRAWR